MKMLPRAELKINPSPMCVRNERERDARREMKLDQMVALFTAADSRVRDLIFHNNERSGEYEYQKLRNFNCALP